mmetsp:Transcript_67158/g.111673  ORF Transcript_67158/g.111673 Transcript_67158/m.111673 type:complete len:299 (+) Transcript_67158:514-1410(+)
MRCRPLVTPETRLERVQCALKRRLGERASLHSHPRQVVSPLDIDLEESLEAKGLLSHPLLEGSSAVVVSLYEEVCRPRLRARFTPQAALNPVDAGGAACPHLKPTNRPHEGRKEVLIGPRHTELDVAVCAATEPQASETLVPRNPAGLFQQHLRSKHGLVLCDTDSEPIQESPPPRGGGICRAGHGRESEASRHKQLCRVALGAQYALYDLSKRQRRALVDHQGVILFAAAGYRPLERPKQLDFTSDHVGRLQGAHTRARPQGVRRINGHEPPRLEQGVAAARRTCAAAENYHREIPA